MTAKNVRIVLATVVSIYGVLSAAVKTNGLHLPPAVSAVLVAAAPVMLAVQHWLSDPSTGTPPAPEGATVPDPAPAPVAPVVGPAPASVATVPVQTSFAQGESATISQPSPAPVAPASWSTMAASPPQAQTTPNPAPPAPAA
jgi:hypothetical protein